MKSSFKVDADAMISTAIGLLDFRSKSIVNFKSLNDRPFVGSSMKSREFGCVNNPPKGTFYKSQNGSMAGTWISNHSNQPFLNESTSAFSINLVKKINKQNALIITKDTLERLASTRPEHKNSRMKFDATVSESLA